MIAGAPAVHYLAIGHIAKDLTPAGARLGGTAAYAALTARALDYTPGLVTAYGDDLCLAGPLAELARARVPSAASTAFENIYGPDGRRQFLRGAAAPLAASAVPAEWRGAPIVHVGPIAREIAPELVASFARAFVGLTPQGWLRQWDAEGRVRRADWPEAGQVLPHAAATVVSLDDLPGGWATAELWAEAAPVLAVTEGPRGCTVFAGGAAPRKFKVEPRVEVDPTGAGDIFAAVFFVHLHETADPWAAARFANEAAALSVTRPGLEAVPRPDEIGLCRVRAGLA